MSPVLEALEAAMERYPDLRVCQLIENATARCFGEREGFCLYQMTDEHLTQALNEF